jgi:hypothetical protein
MGQETGDSEQKTASRRQNIERGGGVIAGSILVLTPPIDHKGV